MANPQTLDPSAFHKAVNKFQATISRQDYDEMRCTTLQDLQLCILDIQNKHASGRRTRNMTRLKNFLDAMEQYGKVIEVFLNASPVLCFVWVSIMLSAKVFILIKAKQGPVKLALQVRPSCIDYPVTASNY